MTARGRVRSSVSSAVISFVVLAIAYGVAVTIDAVLGNGIRVVRRLRGGTGDGR